MNILENKSYSIPEEPFVIASIATIKCFFWGGEVKRRYCVAFLITNTNPQTILGSLFHNSYPILQETRNTQTTSPNFINID